MPFQCSICGEESTRICARCTKDACDNHLCEKCLKCSDCCECEVKLSTPATETVRGVLHPEPPPLPESEIQPDPEREPEPEEQPPSEPALEPEPEKQQEPELEKQPDPAQERPEAAPLNPFLPTEAGLA